MTLLNATSSLPNATEIQWKVRCFQQRFSGQDLQEFKFTDPSFEFAYLDLQKLKDQAATVLLTFTNGQRSLCNLTDRDKNNLALFLLILHKNHPGIFHSIYPLFVPIINTFDLSKLMNSIGIDILYFIKKPNQQLCDCITFDISDISKYFKFDTNFIYPEFTQSLQKRLTLLYQFPSFIPSVFNPLYFSLANTCISTSTFFVDLISQLVIEQVISQEFDKFNDLFEMFPDILPFILCNHQQVMYSDLQRFLPILKLKYEPSIATECLNCFVNELQLANMISFVTSNEISVNEFKNKSLPKLMESVLTQKDIFEYESLKYFSVSPNDISTDYDFIRCYNVLSKLLMLLMLPDKSFKSIKGEIKDLLNNMKSKEILDSTIIDLFSLLFIQKDEKYLFSISTAKSVISLLNSYLTSDNHFITNSLALIKNAETFEDIFNRDTTEIFKAIDSKNWKLSNILTMNTNLFRKMFLYTYSVYTISNFNKIPKEIEQHTNLLNLDISLSLNSNKNIQNSKEKLKDLQSVEMIDFVKK